MLPETWILWNLDEPMCLSPGAPIDSIFSPPQRACSVAQLRLCEQKLLIMLFVSSNAFFTMRYRDH